MKPSHFASTKAGKVVRVGRGDAGYAAFVPHPLPPDLPMTRGLVKLLSEADRAIGRLAGVGQNLPNPHLLAGAFKRREAVLSSRIEGTQASLSDLLLFEAAPEISPPVEDVREVSNYVQALEYGINRRSTLPLSLRLMKELHAILMNGTAGRDKTPGEFRRTQNWIGPPGCTLSTATYVPPPVAEMTEALGALEKYLHARSDVPPLVRLALIHYQFEAIHPFLDGNGRIGRLLITLILCLENILPAPLLYLSVYFEKNRAAYYRGLLRVSQAGDWEEWVEFFLRGIVEQSLDALVRADRLFSLQRQFRETLVRDKANATALRLAEELFAHPAVSISHVCKVLEVTPRSGQLCVDRLVRLRILKESTGRRRSRVYVAEDIVSAVG